MTVRIGVVVNPRSRYIKRNPAAVDRLRRLVGVRGEVVTSRAIAEVDGIVRRFQRDGVDIVAIVGGDGTAGIMARGIVDVYGVDAAPPLALLRGGTMNTVANALRLPRGKPEEHLSRLLEHTRGGVLPPVAWRPTLVANGRLGFLFGTGAFYTFLEQYYRAGHDNPSAVTAVETITRAAGSVLIRGEFARRIVTPHAASVVHDGVELPDRAYLALAAGTVSEVGLGFTPFPDADRHLDAFQFLAVWGKPVDIVRDLPRVWLGRGLRPANGQGVVAHEVVITPKDGVVDYMVDGDLYASHGPLRLSVGPRVPILRV
ncbi:MAG: diacylglycerol kinase [Deltaproteobacteria bacterium]|nr:MAG: diacylglycerol kinase [Deltaproteobacteria bacterium]